MKLRRIVFFGLLVVLTGILSVNTAFAANDNYVSTSVQGYTAEIPVDSGTIVRLSPTNARQVQSVGQANINDMFGVVVDPQQLPLTVTSDGQPNALFVASAGTYNVLVSTQAGAVKAGDYITLSSINGVGMDAGTNKVKVFGRAVDSFDGKGLIVGKAPLKDTSGKTLQTVSLGMIPVTIDIRTNPNNKSTDVNIIEQLRRIGLAIAEKPVDPIRIYLSIIITGISLSIALVVLYAGIRNSVIAVGRNPMSKKSIFRALIEVILTSFLVLIIGLFAVYLLLKL